MELPAVRVQAAGEGPDEARQNAPSAKVVIGREELEKLDAATVGEILRLLPGVNLGADTQGGRRGGRRAGDRLVPRILVDGELLPGGNRPALQLPVELIERIEILRVSTPEFPAGPGGTINLVLRDTPPRRASSFRAGVSHDERAFGARLGGTLGGREGEAGTLLMAFVNRRPVNERRSLVQESGSPPVQTLERDDDRGHADSAYVSLRYVRDLGDGARLSVSPLAAGRKSRLDSLTDRFDASGTLLARESFGIERDRLFGRLRLEWKRRRPGMGEAVVNAFLQGFDESRIRAGLGNRSQNDERARTLTLKVKAPWLAGENHLLTLGAEVRASRRETARRDWQGEVEQDLGGNARALGEEGEGVLWGQDEWQLDGERVLTSGLRLHVQRRAIEDAAGARTTADEHFVLPTLAYLWKVSSQWNFRASLGRSVRLPELSDLLPTVIAAPGANSLANPDRAGNPDLAPERALSAQVALEHFYPERRGSAGVSFTWRRLSDRIQTVTEYTGGRFVARPLNLGSAAEAVVAADVSVKPRIFPRWKLRANAQASRLYAVAGGQAEPTRHALSFGADYEGAAWRFGANLASSSDLVRTASPGLVQTQKARRQLDLYLTRSLGRGASLKFSVDNLLEDPREETVESTVGTPGVVRERLAGVRYWQLILEGKW